jgi:hypothetical protein
MQIYRIGRVKNIPIPHAQIPSPETRLVTKKNPPIGQIYGFSKLNDLVIASIGPKPSCTVNSGANDKTPATKKKGNIQKIMPIVVAI